MLSSHSESWQISVYNENNTLSVQGQQKENNDNSRKRSSSYTEHNEELLTQLLKQALPAGLILWE
jgi:hypothetical protein